MSSPQITFAPVAVATGEPVQLAMQRLLLTGNVLPAGARIIAQHIFRSDEEKPLEVIYSFALPRDAALRRFRITGEGFEAHSELKETEAAVHDYEQGIARGSLATLARQYGDGVINLTVGNLRPKETVTVWLEIVAGVEPRDDGFRFRFPFALAPSYHAGAKAAIVAPGELEMELPASEFGDVILPPFRADASALHQIGFDLSLSSGLDLDEVGSPSHPIRVRQESSRAAHVSLATGKDVPNRDLVLDARLKTIEPQVLAGRTPDGVGHYATVIPSTSFGANPETPRRVVILLDRSGSMKGDPIAQARKAIEACLAVLSERDSFGLVAFDNQAEVFHPALQPATGEVRNAAHEFLQRIDARGGTELANGFLAAAAMLKGGAGDVVILTDGQVAGTETILENVRQTGVRLHCLGIGSASQDRFLTLLARETGGVSRFVTPRERVDLSALELFASIGRPVAFKLQAGAHIQPQPAAFVYSGTPVVLFGEGDETVELSWKGGRIKVPVSFDNHAVAETVWLLKGARLITDWESRYPAAVAFGPLAKRKENRVAARLCELSRTYGLASREMSLVAVVKRAGDRPGEIPETRVVPVGMAQDVLLNAYGIGDLLCSSFPAQAAAPPTPPQFSAMRAYPESIRPQSASVDLGLSRVIRQARLKAPPQQPDAAQAAVAILLELATRLESDGGMPGPDLESRVRTSLVTLLAFLSNGSNLDSGPFRNHVARLIGFLKSNRSLPQTRQEWVNSVVARAEKGDYPAGNWLSLAGKGAGSWDQVVVNS